MLDKTSLLGQQFGQLVVLEWHAIKTYRCRGLVHHGQSKWRCRCVCGRIVIALQSQLTEGKLTVCPNHQATTMQGETHAALSGATA